VANVGRNRLDLSDVHEVELFDGELDRYRLEPGDLLVVEGNGSPEQIGRSAVWRGAIRNCVHQNHLIRVRPGPQLDPEYLGLYWNTPQTSERLRSVSSSTSGLYTLSTAKVKSILIPVIPLSEQRRIVAGVDRQLTILHSLMTAIDHALKRSDRLRRAILESALSGRLVPQNPNDEPASMLLKRTGNDRMDLTKPRAGGGRVRTVKS
jgi:type I restriction enzyme S subunit